MKQLDYETKLDPWIVKNPDKKFKSFKAENPKIRMSPWTFAKRRKIVLGMPATPSMKKNYYKLSRTGKLGQPNAEKDPTATTSERRTRSIYTAVWSSSMQDLKNKDGVTAISEFVGAMNRYFKLNLEPAITEIIGSGIKNFEIRRYSK